LKFIDVELTCKARADSWNIYPIGDVHVGHRNCAENALRRYVKQIQDDPKGLWFGGGDLLDAVKPQDVKRFDVRVLPDWMLEGNAESTRNKLGDILAQQFNRLVGILSPINDKCIGLGEGNHERTMRKLYNDDVHGALCHKLHTEDLTGYAVIRFRFKRGVDTHTVMMVMQHGFGGGRTAGAEPNRLEKFRDAWEGVDIVCRGHSHTFHVMPPKPMLYLPVSGKLPKELRVKSRHALNWGCWLYSHASGPSTYDELADYPARPVMAARINIQPFHQTKGNTDPRIEIRSTEI
jgi:hypothetical protein